MYKLKRICSVVLIAVLMFTVFPFSAMAINEGGHGANASSSSKYKFGCDLSYWNVDGNSLKYSLVDFEKMVADGCEFAILRICVETDKSGAIYTDKAFLEYYKRARAAGMKLGVYMYTYATTYAEAVEDAKWVMNFIESHNMYFEYPIYYDCETEAQKALSGTKASQLVRGWCETLEAGGYFPGVYSIRSFLRKLDDDVLEKYDHWVAHVKSDSASGEQYNWNSLDYSDEFSMWQYAWYGRNYDGVSLNMLDVNVSYKDYPAIMEKYGYNNCGSPEKGLLKQSIALAKEKRYSDFSQNSLEAFRTAYEKAVAVLNSSSSTANDYKNARTALDSAMNPASDVLSLDKNYTATAGTRGDIYDDDLKRLTDGRKQLADPGTNAYSCWSENAEIIVDLGASKNSNAYKMYLAGGTWGIPVPADSTHTLKISYSNDKSSWTELNSASSVSDGGSYDEAWKLRIMTVSSDTPINARYIKFDVSGNGFIWTDEVEVISGEAEKLSGGIYISGYNEKISSGDCHVFTQSFGTITVDNANHSWTANVIAGWSNEENAFIVKSVTVGTGANTPSVNLAMDEIMIAAHSWDGNNEGAVIGSGVNTERLYQLKVGDKIILDGIDTVNGGYKVGAYLTTQHVHVPGAAADCENPQICTKCKEVLNGALGHDEGEIVGNDVKCTRCGEVLETLPEPEPEPDNSDNPDESSEPESSDPESSETESDAPEISEPEISDVESDEPELSNPEPDNSDNFDESEAPDENDETDGEPEDEPVCLGRRGDVNGNNKIDMTDYILLKRFYFNTYNLDIYQIARADIDDDKDVDMTDYILLKRVYFDTYTIKPEIIYVF